VKPVETDDRRAMNYATDRMDRASRNRQGLEGLWKDYRDALGERPNLDGIRSGTRSCRPPCRPADHALLARTLCSLGWNRHAVHHYCCALEDDPRSLQALGDYVQMADLAGWPELSVVAMLSHQSYMHRQRRAEFEDDEAPENDSEDLCPSHTTSGVLDLEDMNASEGFDAFGRGAEGITGFLQRLAAEEADGDCGCGGLECGRASCSFPAFLRPHASAVITALDDFTTNTSAASDASNPQRMPWSAHEIHRRILLRRPLDAVHAWNHAMIPKDLWIALGLDERHAKDDDSHCRSRVGQDVDDDDEGGTIHGVLRMLLIKLLYQTVPILACAVLVADIDARIRDLPPTHSLANGIDSEGHQKQRPQTSGRKYKSHAAFYALIQALVLGDRSVKPSRRHSVPHYHVPLWDVLHGIDQRTDYFFMGHGPRSNANSTSHHVAYATEASSLSVQWRKLMLKATTEPYHHEDDVTALYPVTYHASRRSFASPTSTSDLPPLYLVGDSHVLSLAWQTIQLPVHNLDETNHRLVKFMVVPVLVTGLKAYHCRREARFFTRTRLMTSVRRLRASGCRTIAISAGEIDCREGFGGSKLEGYRSTCPEAVPENVEAYLSSLQEILALDTTLEQILVLPVAPHVSQTSSRVAGQVSRRRTMRDWNHNLRTQLPNRPGMFLVDYIENILEEPAQELSGSASYCLRGDMAADSTHMNAAFARSFEQAIVSSGCNMSLFL
jgi:hypothetical protein